MGNQPAKIQFNMQQHQRLGLIKFLELPTSQQQHPKIEIQCPVTSQKAYLHWLQSLRKFNTELTRELFYLPQKFKFQPSGLCGNSGMVYETQIWYLLYKMVQAEAVFQKMHVKVGDFNPKSILLNENGQIRIISTFSLLTQTDNFTKITQHILADVYLAPEQINLKSIEQSRYPDNVDPNKAELFCIGITLIEAATLEDCTFIYTRNPLKLQYDKLQRLKNILANKYSGFLCQFLREMLEIDPKKRRTAQNLVDILRPYEHMILDLQSVNWSQVQYSSVKSSAFFNDGTNPKNKGSQLRNFTQRSF